MKRILISSCLAIIMIVSVFCLGCHNAGYGDYVIDRASVPSGGLGVISGNVTASGAISVSFRDRASVRASVNVSSAAVWLQDNPEIASNTNASGTYILVGVPFGNNNRVVAKFQLKDATGQITTYKVRSPKLVVTDAAPVHADTNLDLQLASNTVSGILLDSQGSPIPFAALEVWGEAFHSDANGRFEAPPLPPPAASETAVETITVKTPGFSSDPITTNFGPPGTTFVEVTVPKVTEANKPPRIMLFRDPSEGSVPGGGKTTVWAVYFDPDGTPADLRPLTWDISDGLAASSSTSLPTSLKTAVDLFTTGIPAEKIGIEALSWTAPQEEGYQAITARIRDLAGVEAKGTLKIPVANPLAPPPPLPVNRPPVPTILATGTAPAGSQVTLEALPNDPDGNFGMNFAWTVEPNDGTFSAPKAGRTVWTAPLSTGTYQLICTVTDSAGLSGKAIHNLVVYPVATVAPPPPNQAPAPKIVSLRTVTIGRDLSLQAIPNDPDGDTGLTYMWTASPTGGVFSSITTALATWTAPSATGTYELRCAVSDGQITATATQKVTVISDIPVSAPRRISGYVRDQASDAPIVGALVVISGSGIYAITDDQG
ncbi:MAG: hypothetical protein HQM09_03770, partial [Candidatus Riflebacteria bacterium]|nr:hypothetical protein [Candidatus Riflebacteria bacterium]